MKIKVINILWDLDDEDEDVDLPTNFEVEVESEDDEDIAKAVSDEYGFTFHGLDYEALK